MYIIIIIIIIIIVSTYSVFSLLLENLQNNFLVEMEELSVCHSAVWIKC